MPAGVSLSRNHNMMGQGMEHVAHPIILDPRMGAPKMQPGHYNFAPSYPMVVAEQQYHQPPPRVRFSSILGEIHIHRHQTQLNLQRKRA
jgi:hypothetical protein